MDIYHRYAPFIQEFIYRNAWESLRAIQVAAGDAIFNTQDNVLLCASTASGKTEAAFFPILTLLSEDPPASVGALGRFCAGTKLYPVNAERFKRIVERVEARSITPEKLAEKTLRVLKKKRPRFAYNLNRNPLLLMLGALPRRMQFWIIRKVLS